MMTELPDFTAAPGAWEQWDFLGTKKLQQIDMITSLNSTRLKQKKITAKP